MAVVRKTILKPGMYTTAAGKHFHATPARLKAFAAKFHAMRGIGIRVPVAWGHQPGATPKDKGAAQLSTQEREYATSRYNAGYLQDVLVDPATGNLDMLADIPGATTDAAGNILTEATLPDGRKVQCAVGEVSAGVRDWRDGQGRLWPDSIIHVALTTLPVVAGQGGFAPYQNAPAAPGETRLSLSGFINLSTEGESMFDVASETVLQPVLAKLESVFKLKMPADTTPENFMERLMVALTAVEGQVAADRDADRDLIEEPAPSLLSSTAQTVAERLAARRAMRADARDRAAKFSRSGAGISRY